MNAALKIAQERWDSLLPEDYGFAGFVPEWLAEVDGSECPMAQLLLAVRRGDFELAQDIWFDRFESTLIGNAWKLVRQEI